MFKLQIKYAALKKNGTIEIRYRTSWADKNGSHIKKYKEQDFDYYAIYCYEKDIVLYIPNKLDCPKAISFSKPSNNQKEFVKWAKDYLVLK